MSDTKTFLAGLFTGTVLTSVGLACVELYKRRKRYNDYTNTMTTLNKAENILNRNNATCETVYVEHA